jgi:peroxiredoxin-like protein
METKKTRKSFRYQTQAVWEQARKIKASAAGKPDLGISSPPEFKGDQGVWTPEDLFVTALNSCIMETFLAFAEHKGLGLTAYDSSVDALLDYQDGKYRFTEITVHPQIAVKSQDDVERARQIMESAHANCFISNSITASVNVIPEFRVMD